MGANIVSDKRRAQARKHAERRYVCSCGRVCSGNGGWSSHKRACAVYQEARANARKRSTEDAA